MVSLMKAAEAANARPWMYPHSGKNVHHTVLSLKQMIRLPAMAQAAWSICL